MSAKVLVRAGHASLQYSDNLKQKQADVDRLHERFSKQGLWWLTGTEAGPQTGLPEMLREMAADLNCRFTLGRSNFIMVSREHIMPRTWRAGWEFAVDTDDVVGHGLDLGVTWAYMADKDIGPYGVLGSHYATKGRPNAKDPVYGRNLKPNTELARVIGELGEKFGAGTGLCWYGGDQNIDDRRDDTFLGQANFLTAGDELKKWPNTGHGPIDVIARWRAGGRVKAVRWEAFDDKKFFLNTDHFYVEADYEVEPLVKATPPVQPQPTTHACPACKAVHTIKR